VATYALSPLAISINYHSLYYRETRRLTGTQKHYTREQIFQYIEGKAQDSSSVLLLIARRDDDQVIGDIQIGGIYTYNRSAWRSVSVLRLELRQLRSVRFRSEKRS